MSRKLIQNVLPSIGWSKGTIEGIRNETRTLIIIIYDIIPERLPPSLSVITPAAKAVGQIRQSIAVSTSTVPSVSGLWAIRRPVIVKTEP